MLRIYTLSFILNIFLMHAYCSTFISSLNLKEISADQILEEFTNLSITQCYLRCSNIPKCKAIGMSADIKMGEKGNCYTLKNIDGDLTNKGKSEMIVGKKSTVEAYSCDNFLGYTSCNENDKADEGLCSITRNRMIIAFSHDKEREILSTGYEDDFDNISLHYNASLQCIKSVVTKKSMKCFQSFYVESRDIHPDYVKFVTTNEIEFNTNSESCLNCKSLFENVSSIKKGYGNITDAKLLPLKSVLISDTGDSIEYAKITLEKLVCIKEQ